MSQVSFKTSGRITTYHIPELRNANYPSIVLMTQINTKGDDGGAEVVLRYTRSEATALIVGLTAAIEQHDAEYQPAPVNA